MVTTTMELSQRFGLYLMSALCIQYILLGATRGPPFVYIRHTLPHYSPLHQWSVPTYQYLFTMETLSNDLASLDTVSSMNPLYLS